MLIAYLCSSPSQMILLFSEQFFRAWNLSWSFVIQSSKGSQSGFLVYLDLLPNLLESIIHPVFVCSAQPRPGRYGHLDVAKEPWLRRQAPAWVPLSAQQMRTRCLVQQSQHGCSGPPHLSHAPFSFFFLPTPTHHAFNRFSKELVSHTVKVCSRVGNHRVIQLLHVKCLAKANP